MRTKDVILQAKKSLENASTQLVDLAKETEDCRANQQTCLGSCINDSNEHPEDELETEMDHAVNTLESQSNEMHFQSTLDSLLTSALSGLFS